MQRLIDEIQVQNNLTITLAKTKIKDEKLRDCIGDVSYITTKVTEACVVEKCNKNQGRGSNFRRISSVDGRGRGRVRRG